MSTGSAIKRSLKFCQQFIINSHHDLIKSIGSLFEVIKEPSHNFAKNDYKFSPSHIRLNAVALSYFTNYPSAMKMVN